MRREPRSDRNKTLIDVDMRHEIYFANRKALVAYATRILGSRDTAEDIVQEAFLRFSPAKAGPASSSQPLAYLYRIVRNLAFDVLKRQKLETRERQNDMPCWSMPVEMPTPEEIALVTDEVRNITRILEDLPVEVRIALEMHRFGGYTLEEIAAHLDISVATAHRYVRMAMLRVATSLAAAAS